MLAVIAFTACAGKSKDNKPEENNTTKEVKKMGTIHLTKACLLYTSG